MQINIHQNQCKREPTHHIPTLLLSILTLCLIMLSSCGNNSGNTSSNTSTTIPAPAIDLTTKNQGDTQLLAFQQWITLIQQYNGNTTIYQQQYNVDQQALKSAKTDYPLGYEYGSNGIGGWVQQEINSAQTLADYQQTIEDLNMYLTNFQAMTTNAVDKTPYNQVHQTDLQMMQHYGFMHKKVVVVSLSEQAMRVYQNGKLVNAFLVTTGRPEKPSPPGTWWVEGKKSPTVYKATVPQSSPYWYPDTPINYSMQYHSNGYFLHDSWWRADYGLGTNFPHQDTSGDSYSFYGSHGCVNIAKDNAAWLYNFVALYTTVLVY